MASPSFLHNKKYLGISLLNPSFFAGAISSLTGLLVKSDSLLYLAQYIAARALQAILNDSGTREKMLSSFVYNHSTSLVFSVCTATIMYAFILRPESLPPNYFNFISKLAGLHPTIIEAIRRNVRGQEIDKDALNALIRRQFKEGEQVDEKLLLTTTLPPAIPCSLLHIKAKDGCVQNQLKITFEVFKKSFILYLAIYSGPTLLFKLKELIKRYAIAMEM